MIFGSTVPSEEVPPPGLVQMFGQRFVVNSYVLNRVVYDAVPRRDGIPVRMMPQGLDAMAALGNAEAWGLLAGERAKYQYEPQLAAAREFTARYFADAAGQKSLYDLWLAALRSLDADLSAEKCFPKVMRGEPWRLKQLHTQLASWAELRHDGGILYVKQSYSRNEECQYPAGYVEPYPEFYAQVRAFADRAAAGLADLAGADAQLGGAVAQPRRFWQAASLTMNMLETLARKELRGEAFTAAEEKFIHETVNVTTRQENDGCDNFHTVRSYSGWYCNLFYPTGETAVVARPTVADVHTNPRDHEVPQGGRRGRAIRAGGDRQRRRPHGLCGAGVHVL